MKAGKSVFEKLVAGMKEAIASARCEHDWEEEDRWLWGEVTSCKRCGVRKTVVSRSDTP